MRASHSWVKAAALILALALIAGCQPAPAGDAAATAPTDAAQPTVAGAARAIEKYVEARVAADVDKMIALSCADWEGDARKEAASLRGVKARLNGLVCATAGISGNATLVACQGDIVATYNGEDRALSLAKRKFKAVADGGEWRMCGYEG